MNWKQKLSSRKLWACVVGVVVGIAVAFGVDGNTITTVAGAVTSMVSVIAYVVTEGKIDKAAVNQLYIDTETIVEEVKEAIFDEMKVGGSE